MSKYKARIEICPITYNVILYKRVLFIYWNIANIRYNTLGCAKDQLRRWRRYFNIV